MNTQHPDLDRTYARARRSAKALYRLSDKLDATALGASHAAYTDEARHRVRALAIVGACHLTECGRAVDANDLGAAQVAAAKTREALLEARRVAKAGAPTNPDE